jgi:hypothetical protein
MNDKPAHVKVAEDVLKKVSPTIRKRLTLTAKGSYTIVADKTGWVARITAKVAEFNKKRVQPKALTEAGMTEIGKDEFHRLHGVGIAAAASNGKGEAKAKAKGDDEPVGPGADVVAKAVGVAAKPVKS